MNVRRVTVAIAVPGLIGALLAGGADAKAAPPRDAVARSAVPKSAPSWIGHAKHLGKASSSSRLQFRVYLAPRGGIAGLRAAVAATSTPSSPSYRKFLTAAQYHRIYDPSVSSVHSVRAWLSDSGLSVLGVAAHNAYLQVSGTVAQTEHTFSTPIDRYVHNGVQVQANTTALSIPQRLAGSVSAVIGIDTSRAAAKPQTTPPPPDPGFNNGHPCSTFYGQLTAKVQADYATPLPKFQGKYLPYAVCGYTGPQFRAAYEGGSTLTGDGVTVGVVDAYASPTVATDVNNYATLNGDGSYANGQLVQVLPSSFRYPVECPDPAGWYAEESLDIEAVHAMAPDARIRYYSASSCDDSDFLTAITKVVNQDKVQLVSNSYGAPDEGESTGIIAADEQVFLQGALEGISFMFSSADNGDELAHTGIKQTDSSASDPYVTAVGGTATAIGGDGRIRFQTGWGTQKYSLTSDGSSWTPLGFLYGAGGGYSNLFNRPDYQNGVVPASAPPGRAVPDVAMDADVTTGMLIGLTQTFTTGVRYGQYRIGGTSLASPLFAGMTALLVQHAGGGLGFLNPTIYGQYGTGTFTDVKGQPKDAGNVRVDYANGEDPSGGLLYSVRTFNQDSSLTTTPGWDDVTGVGVPNKGWTRSIGPIT